MTQCHESFVPRALLLLLGGFMAAPALADTLTLSASSTTGCRPVTGTITLTEAAPAEGVTFALSSSNANAEVPATVTVAGGATTTTFTVTTTAVASQVTAAITATGSPPLSRNLVIRPMSATAFAMSPNRVAPGSTSTGTVTLACVAGPGAVTVNLSTSNPLVTVPASIVIPAGAPSGTFTATVGATSTSTAVTMTATLPGGTRTTSLTVAPPTPASITFTPATPVGSQPTVGTVTLDSPAPPGGQAVDLASNNALATPNVAQVIVAAGATTATFGVTTLSTNVDVVVTFTATANGTSRTKTMTVRKNRMENFNVSSQVLSVCREVTGEVKLFAPAAAGGTVVTLDNDQPTLVSLSTNTLNFAAGEQRQTFTLTALRRDTNAEANIVARLTRTPTDIQVQTEVFDVIRVSSVACP
jgi:hypothetical protein